MTSAIGDPLSNHDYAIFGYQPETDKNSGGVEKGYRMGLLLPKGGQ